MLNDIAARASVRRSQIKTGLTRRPLRLSQCVPIEIPMREKTKNGRKVRCTGGETEATDQRVDVRLYLFALRPCNASLRKRYFSRTEKMQTVLARLLAEL